VSRIYIGEQTISSINDADKNWIYIYRRMKPNPFSSYTKKDINV
jgi:hypothetical protein